MCWLFGTSLCSSASRQVLPACSPPERASTSRPRVGTSPLHFVALCTSTLSVQEAAECNRNRRNRTVFDANRPEPAKNMNRPEPEPSGTGTGRNRNWGGTGTEPNRNRKKWGRQKKWDDENRDGEHFWRKSIPYGSPRQGGQWKGSANGLSRFELFGKIATLTCNLHASLNFLMKINFSNWSNFERVI